MDDATERLRAGTLDYGPQVAGEAVEAMLGDPALKARADAPVTTSVALLAINPQVPPLDNVECRRAVVRALDLSALARVHGTTGTSTSLPPPTIAGRRHADPNLTPAGDPEAARESLRACGSPSGFTATCLYQDLSPVESSAAEAGPRSPRSKSPSPSSANRSRSSTGSTAAALPTSGRRRSASSPRPAALTGPTPAHSCR
ncbi:MULTISPECIES: ABC transporter substrate-binding protein [unclassified Nonomuraea]|uniref:ABC transporter substrate-binding protein n=1 Tax=unclassified Nonomuraea TaxID=2593643 RepID=UPI001376EA9E|nr:ABC transporter substrate-binding protein [Nonomuraea sp. KC401]NBE99223.1 hypothetical protein [Nonomuraea sp. K271]